MWDFSVNLLVLFGALRVKFQQNIKLPPVGIELTTQRHWFRSLVLTQLSTHVCIFGEDRKILTGLYKW